MHRDLKPGNIFNDDGVVKIGDYGLSKFISCSRRSGQTESVGTFHYMAPEIGKGVYGKEIDIYALGIMLCEMLTGSVPFEGETSQEIIMKHLTADPDLSRVPARFRRVIERALFKDPAKRFGSVSDMLQALQFDGAGPAHSAAAAGGSLTSNKPPVILTDASASAPAPAASAGADPQGSKEPIYIDDDGIATDEIVFGPVVEKVSSAGQKPPVVHPVPAREPIAAALGATCGQVTHWWSTANLSTPIKVLLLVGAILLLLLNSQWLVPAAVVLGCMYLVYFGVRAVVVNTRGPIPSARPARCCAAQAGTRRTCRTRGLA